MSKGSNPRRMQDHKKVRDNWPKDWPDPFERAQAARRAREAQAKEVVTGEQCGEAKVQAQ